MAVFINRNDYDFLVQSERFCNRIDNYVNTLDLDYQEVENYKNDNQLFRHVFNSPLEYSTTAEKFVQNKIENMRLQFNYLKKMVMNNKKYTLSMGLDLGIEEDFMAFSAN